MIEKKTYTVVKKISRLRLTSNGGKLYKSLVLKSIPVLPNEAVNRLYCETTLTSHLNNDGHLNQHYIDLINSLSGISSKLQYLTGLDVNVKQYINGLVSPSGGVMTGSLKLNYTPTSNTALVNKKYVDDRLRNDSFFSIGEILIKPSNTSDPEWLKCDGGLYDISSYPGLYGVIGQSYAGGVSIPAGKFKVPNTVKTDKNIPSFSSFIKT